MANYLTAEEIEFLKKRSDELFMGKTFCENYFFTAA